MSKNVRTSLALVALFAVVVVVVTLAAGGGAGVEEASTPTETPAQSAPPTAATGPSKDAAPAGPVVTPDPRTLGRPGRSSVTFTEFLDFECEACGAVFPAIEQLRERYAGRVTFNIRYFPIDSHSNARNAALAVEAAAQQDRLEAMYKRMYETQTEWAEQQDSKASVFRAYARDLGLDMKAYDKAVASPATAERVQRDSAAGQALGVQGTPTFFIGEELIQPQSIDEIAQMIDAALKRA